MQFNDQPQHVTIGISSDDLLAAVRLRSARLCVLECMPQIGKRDAALLHRGPSMILNEDSTAARKGPDSALRFRFPSPAGRYAETMHFVKSRCYVDNFLDKIWTKLMTNRQKGLAARTAKTW